MSVIDKQKWDAKYLKKSQLLLPRDASTNLKAYIKYTKPEYALDIACGAGRNSIFLAENGFKVDAVDIAKLALDTLNEESKAKNLTQKITTHLIDLDVYEIEKDKYDLIIMANYLNRDIIKKAKISIKKDGILFVETYMLDDANEKTKSDMSNLLQSQELKNIIDNSFKILYYDEFKNEDYEIYKMKKQVIVAKKTKD